MPAGPSALATGTAVRWHPRSHPLSNCQVASSLGTLLEARKAKTTVTSCRMASNGSRRELTDGHDFAIFAVIYSKLTAKCSITAHILRLPSLDQLKPWPPGEERRQDTFPCHGGRAGWVYRIRSNIASNKCHLVMYLIREL